MEENRTNNILIVDDTPENLTMLRQMLTNHGYVVRPAISGEIALKAVKQHQPDLILLDVMMPGIDGYEVCRQLKADPGSREIPVIFITALSETTEKVKGFSYGGVDYITKPFHEEEVLVRIRTHIALKNAIRDKEESILMLKAIHNSIPDTIITVDADLKVINANKEMDEVCLNAEQGKKFSFQQRLSKEEGPCHKILDQTLNTKKPVKDYRTTCSCGFGNNKTLVLNATPLIDQENEFSGAVMVIRDISHLADLETELLERNSFQNIIGKNEKMQKIFSLLEQTTELDVNLLITGESGTGKELIADAIHHTGCRSEGPLVKVNCAALSENLLESELFGHVRGAFTGAVKDRTGRIKAAEGGTIFLDEIGDVSPAFQAKLLRFLEQKEYERIGDSKTLKADVRVLAATNQDLPGKIKRGEFREDLLYRLKGMVVQLPPLRDRIDDIPLLINHFIQLYRKSKNILGVSEEVTKLFLSHNWQGNIREMKNIMEYACALCRQEIISKDHLPADFIPVKSKELPNTQAVTQNEDSEKSILLEMLNRTDWNKAKTARMLGVSRGTLYNKIIRHGIDEPVK